MSFRVKSLAVNEHTSSEREEELQNVIRVGMLKDASVRIFH